jgi:hypothetical protein
MNYLQKKKLAFMSIVNSVKGFVRTITGSLPLTLEGCVDEKSITDYKLYGQSVQDGTPTPDTPIEVESVGEYDETTGKYKIPVKVSYNDKSITTNIYLDEPLRKVGDYADYVDLENGKVVRNIAYERIDTVTTKSSAGLMFLSTISQKPILTGAANSPVGYATSDKFKRHTSNYAQLPGMGKNAPLIQSYITSGGGYRIAYTFGDTSITTVALAQEAIGDGFDVFYALATPTETSIVLPTIPTFKGTSIISADTTVQPSNAEIEYYSNVKE